MYWRIPASVLLATLTTLTAASAVFAHAAHQRSNPAPGQVLSTSPATVEIFTTQDLQRSGNETDIAVENEQGTRVDNGDTRIDDSNRRRYFVTLKPSLPAGRYVVRFRTLSDEDGENDSGAYAFYIGAQPTDAQKSEDAKFVLSEKSLAVDTDEQGANQTPLIIGAVVGIVVLALLGAGGWVMMRSRGASL